MPPGIRDLIDDWRRISFVLSAVVAVWAATYWYGWASSTALPLPVRVVGGLGVLSLVFFLWYAVLFTSHKYFGKPQHNPLIPPPSNSTALLGSEAERLPLRFRASVDNGLVGLDIDNRGPSETFLAEVIETGPAPLGPSTHPPVLRWKGSTSEKQEIIKGHVRTLEVLRVTHVKVPEHKPEGRFTLGEISLTCVVGERPIAVQTPFTGAATPFRVIRPVRMVIRVSAIGSGAGETIEVIVSAATDGYSAPLVDAVVVRYV
jgi:hypothetical protein